MIILPDFADPSFVSHAFFTRQGGVSAGLYDSLNCGPGSRDVPENVIENRARAARKLGMPAHALLTLRQEHQARMNANTPDFKTLDSNGDGQLSHDELRNGMHQQMQKINAQPTTK